MAFTKVTGTLVDIGDLDLTNVGQIQLDSIAGDADANTSITFSGSDVITIATGGSGRLTIGDGALSPVTTNQIDLGTSSLEFKDAFFDGTVTSDAFAGPLTGDVTGTIQTAAQPNITSLGTLTALTVDDITIDGSTISDGADLTINAVNDIILTATDIRPRTDLFVLNNAANNKNQIVVQSAAVKLYYDGTKQLETVSGGIQVNTIGQLGNVANDLTIFSTTSGHNGLRFHANGILATDNAGAIVDNDADLGDPSYRFKDLHLGGSAYINGNVGIGETTPLATLHIKQGDSGLSSLNAAAHHLFLEDTGANGPGITFASGTTSNCTLAFGDSDSNYQGVILYDNSADAMKFGTNGGTEAMRITSSQNLCIGGTANTGVGKGGLRLTYGSGESDGNYFFVGQGGGSNAISVLMEVVQATGYATTTAAMKVGRHTGNNRSINAGGTVNASGADYAEYMLKSDSCGDIAKGDVVGVDSDGKLTKKFSEANSFVIKSTDPSYVGGDTWWTESEPEPKFTDDTKTTKTDDFIDWETRMETARVKVDRIAFSGQVPVNITGSFNVGDYVYPQANGTEIQAVAKSTPTFEEYQLCVGKIWTTMDDGRPLVAVKVG